MPCGVACVRPLVPSVVCRDAMPDQRRAFVVQLSVSASSFPAVVPAAGLSRRMGTPKQLLPWRQGTILTAVIDALQAGGCAPVVCVLGHEATRIAVSLATRSVALVRNPAFRQGEMLSSVQCALRWLQRQETRWPGCLLALGDQPGLPASAVRAVADEARRHPTALTFPSYRRRRGHPFAIPATLWPDILALPAGASLRAVTRRAEAVVRYVDVNTPWVLQDVDTPEEYHRGEPEAH